MKLSSSKITSKNNFSHFNIIFSFLFCSVFSSLGMLKSRDGFRGGGGWQAAPCFCNHFEELQTVLIEVKLIIDNTPLTFFYSNITSTAIRSLTVLSSTTDKINRISNHFWHRWRHEYVVNLCETQRASKLNINCQKK